MDAVKFIITMDKETITGHSRLP